MCMATKCGTSDSASDDVTSISGKLLVIIDLDAIAFPIVRYNFRFRDYPVITR